METALPKPKLPMWLKVTRVVAYSLALLLLGGGAGWWLARNVEVTDRGPVMLVNRESQPETIDFSLFWEVWDKLHQEYLDQEKLDTAKMVYGAIEGMTAAIGDPYTVFLPPSDNQQAKQDLNGEFEGVGIQLGYIDRNLAVMSPLEKHPAIKAGVRAGDLILHIKDEAEGVDTDTVGMSLPEAVKLIRGRKGTAVTLTILHEDETEPVEITMVRDSIIVPSVEVEMIEDGQVAWLKLYRFGENTQQQWDQAVKQILGQKVKGVVLDVRNNPGGFLLGSVYVASEFIKDGVVVKQQGKYQTQNYDVERKGNLIGMPLVVLVNKGSASAAEIVAGALRDRLKTKLIGEATFGKGTVQDAQDLRDGAGIHITTGRWLFPSGEWIAEDGIKPDVEIELDKDASASAEIDAQLMRAVEELR